MDKFNVSHRTTVRWVVFKDNKEAIVANWYYAQHSDCHVKKTYATLESYMQDITDDFTDEAYMSDGECLDIAIELYDKGIAYL